LQKATLDGNSEIRQASLTVLSQLDTPAALGVLTDALTDADDQVRVTAVQLLVRNFPEEAQPSIIQAAGDEAAAVREVALRALASGKSDGAFEALVHGRWDNDYRVSRTAVEGLGNFGKRSLPPLQEALGDNRLSDQAALQALGMIGLPALPLLLEGLEHDRLPARRAAADALLNLLATGSLPDEDQQQILQFRKELTFYGEPALVDVLGNF